MFTLLLLLATCASAQTPDIVPADWSGAEYYGNGWGPGGKPKDPTVPEPSNYGAFLMAGTCAYLLTRRRRKQT